MKYNLLNSFLFVTLLATIFMSCSESEPLATNNRETNVRFWNVMPDANVSSLDILIDGSFVTNIQYGSEQTEYSKVISGLRNLKVTVGGNRNLVTIDTLPDFSNRQNQFFTFMVLDSARINAPFLTRDNYNLNPDTLTGRYQLRFLHASPNAPVVQLAIAGETDTIALNSGTGFVRNLSNDSLTTQLPFRTYRLSATNSSLADTTVNLVLRTLDRSVVIPIGSINLREKSVYTILARGFVGGTGNQAFTTRIFKDR